MSHTALRREFSDLIELDASVDRLAGGFTFTEGPIWNPRDQCSCFPICRPTCAAAGTNGAASARS